MKLHVWILLVVAVLFFYGCAADDEINSTPIVESVPVDNEESTPTDSSTDLESPTTIFESPISPLETPVASSTAMETPIALDQLPTVEPPSPEDDVGAVYGRLIDPEGLPRSEIVIRLGKVIWIEGREGEEGLVVSDRARSPEALTDEWGNFVITDIQPEEYGIVVIEPIQNEPLFVIDPSGEKLRVIEIEAGKVIDLEVIEIDFDY